RRRRRGGSRDGGGGREKGTRAGRWRATRRPPLPARRSRSRGGSYKRVRISSSHPPHIRAVRRMPTGDPAGCDHGAAMPADSAAIVVVEDDPHIADLVELYLRRESFRVYQAADGEHALEVIRERRPRLVILDLGLPGGLDGLGVCKQVRASSDVPIIMLTARDDEVDRVLGLELGADDYVLKPFSPRELVARVKAILRRAEAPARSAPAV